MDRRKFLKNIGKISAAPIMLKGIGVNTFANSEILQMLATCDGVRDRSIVVVFLKGGNDGLNTLIPINQYDRYRNLRPKIGLSNFNNIDASLALEDQVGIHPSANALNSMYEDGNCRIFQGVGYPAFNQSHFRSTDIWLGGRDGNYNSAQLGDGWIGRFLEEAYPGIHGNPNSEYPDPLGLQFGDRKASQLFHDHSGKYEAVNVSGQNLDDLAGLLNRLGTAPHTPAPPYEYGDMIKYIMNVESSTNLYGQRISQVYNAGSNSSINYSNSDFGQQLKRVAKLISGGSHTKVFNVHKTGFDTHGMQVILGSTQTGMHAELISDVFSSIKSFHEDLKNLGQSRKVLTLVFSEFSRSVSENVSLGTDHGSYGPMFIFGDGVSAGVTGTNLNLNQLDGQGNFLASEMQLDYRSVLKTVLQDWMGTGNDILGGAEINSYEKIDGIIDENMRVDPNCYIGSTIIPVELVSFTANVNRKSNVDLQWETSSEINVDYFEIIRKSDEVEEETILKVEAGNDINGLIYTAIDDKPLIGISYYRLKATDLDGSEEFSKWRSVKLPEQAIRDVTIYPNPAKYDINIAMTADDVLHLNITLFSMDGKLVLQHKVETMSGFNKVNLDLSNLEAGTYLIKVLNERSLMVEKQIVKL